jgi:dihydroorotate dehydrogenase (NAD+) catalytic subunit
LPLIPTDDFPGFIRALLAKYGLDEVAQVTSIPTDRLLRWGQGENHHRPADENLLYGFCVNRREFDLIWPHLPSYDRQNAYNPAAPPLGYDLTPPQVRLLKRPTRIAGLEVNFPFGISASVLTRNSDTIRFYASRGFDLLTYKTVRSTPKPAHHPPNWVFIDAQSIDHVKPPFDQPVIGDPYFYPSDVDNAAMANSYGVPSQDPDVWQRDVEASKQYLSSGQVLIVSVVATLPSGSWTQDDMVNDFVKVSRQAKEAGADIVEVNFSCPNTPGEQAGQIYHDPELAGRICAEVKRQALPGFPLLVKIGYLERQPLVEFVRQTQRHVQGIVAINTISMPVNATDGTELFPGRREAGISGPAIRRWARQTVADLVEVREEEGTTDDLAVIAVGGVTSPRDVYDYLNIGADAVESCTGAYLNPNLAIEARAEWASLALIRPFGRPVAERPPALSQPSSTNGIQETEKLIVSLLHDQDYESPEDLFAAVRLQYPVSESLIRVAVLGLLNRGSILRRGDSFLSLATSASSAERP